MPNGFQGTLEEWQRIEAPYVRIDPILEEFASLTRLKLEKNYHDANRFLRWNNGVDKAIWVLPMSDYDQTGNYRVSIVASIDKRDGRYMKHGDTRRDVPTAELSRELHRAWKIVESWCEDDLHLGRPGERTELL